MVWTSATIFRLLVSVTKKEKDEIFTVKVHFDYKFGPPHKVQVETAR